MMKYACQYKIVRFAPFTETDEFANIGIVLLCPATLRIEFRFANARFGRITQFFDGMDPSIYKNVIYTLRAEFQRTQKLITQHSQAAGRAIFAELTRPKGGVIRFSDTRIAFTENVEKEVDKLFDHYVSRNFNTPVYREQILEKELKSSLKLLSLDKVYKKASLNAGLYEIQMPFVRQTNGKNQGVIKPLAFDQKTTGNAVEHADKWYSRAQHLIEHSVEADNLMFALDISSTKDKQLRHYLDEFKNKLSSIGIHAVDADDKKQLTDFVQHH